MRGTTSIEFSEQTAPRRPASAEPTILQRLALGDDDAMQVCMQTYGGLVLSLARRQLSSGTGDVEDGVQEVFLAIWQAAGRFDPARGSEVAFVATLAQRKLIDHRRRACAHNRVVLKSYISGRRHAHSHLPPDYELGEEARRADRVLRELPGDVQDTLALALYRGLSYRNIAAAVGAPNGTIKSWASRGLQRLRERMRPEPGALADVA